MHDHWLDEHVGPEASMRSGFEDELAETLSSAWNGLASQERIPLQRARDAAGARRIGWRVGWIAMAAAIIAALFVVVALRRPDGDRNQPSTPSNPAIRATVSPTPPVGVVPTAPGSASTVPAPTTTSAPTATPTTSAAASTVAPSTVSSPTVPAAVLATAPPSTAAAVPVTLEHVLTVAATGGDVVSPTVIASIPVGTGAGQLTAPNGPFGTLVAVLPDSIVLPDYDATSQALTGRAVILSRSGTYERDVLIDGAAGVAAEWVGGAPDGTLFVVSRSADSSSFHIVAYRLSGDVYQPTRTADVPSTESATFDITSRGLEQGGQVAMAFATGASPTPLIAQFVQPTVPGATDDPNSAEISVVRGADPSTTTWSVDLQLDAVNPPLDDIMRSGIFGTGAWFTEFTSGDSDGAFLAVLSPVAGQSHSYRFGPWSLAASDADQLILTEATQSGIVIAVLNAPA